MQTIRVNDKIRVNDEETHYYNPKNKTVYIVPREGLRMLCLGVTQEAFDDGSYDKINK